MLILIKLQNKIASIYFFPSQIIGGILCLAIVVYKYGITYIRENVLSYEDSILLFDKTINKYLPVHFVARALLLLVARAPDRK